MKAEKDGKFVMGVLTNRIKEMLLGVVMMKMTSGAVESLLVVCLTAVSKDPAALGAARVTVSHRHRGGTYLVGRVTPPVFPSHR